MKVDLSSKRKELGAMQIFEFDFQKQKRGEKQFSIVQLTGHSQPFKLIPGHNRTRIKLIMNIIN